MSSLPKASTVNKISNNTADKLTSLVNQFGNVNSFSNITNNAANIQNMSPSKLASMIPNSSELFSKLGDPKLSSTTTDLINRTQGSMTDIFNNSFNGSGALEQPLAFVSKTSKSAIDGLSLDAFATNFPSLDSFSSDSIRKISDMSGINVNNGSSLSSALSSIGSSIKNGMSSAIGIGSSMISGITNTVSSVIKGATSVVSTATGVVAGFIGSATSGLASVLPNSAQNLLGPITNNNSGFTDDLMDRVNSIFNYGGGLINDPIDGLFNIYNGNNGYGFWDNPSVTDVNGNYIPGISNSRLSSNTISNYYQQSNSICPNINIPDLLDFGLLKDIYDLLLSQLANNGLFDLLKQLLACRNFYDSRSDYVLRNQLDSLARAGDIQTMNVILNKTGTSRINNTSNLALSTAANMKYDDTNKSEYNDMLKMFNMSGDDLYRGGYNNSYSAQNVVITSYNSNQLANSVLGNNNADLIQSAAKLFM